jgi:two-component system NarL family sensor kinase
VTDRAPAPDAAATNRGVALLRLALVPIALIVDLPDRRDAAFVVVLTLFGVYATALLALSLRSPRRPPAGPQAIADLAWIAALVYVSGGADSPLRFAFFVMPIAAAVRLSPRLTALWLALALAAYLLVAVPHPRTDVPEDLDFIVEQGLALLWVGTGAVMLSALLARRERSLAALAEARRRLVRQALEAEARERRRLAEALHDEAIQNVLAAAFPAPPTARARPSTRPASSCGVRCCRCIRSGSSAPASPRRSAASPRARSSAAASAPTSAWTSPPAASTTTS